MERDAPPDTLIVVAETFYSMDDYRLRRLKAVPGDRLLVAPWREPGETRPEIQFAADTSFSGEPDCELRSHPAGEVRSRLTDAYEAAGEVPVARCCEGASSATSRGREQSPSSALRLHDELRSAGAGQRSTRDEPRRLPVAGDTGMRQRVEGEVGGVATVSTSSRPCQVDILAAVPSRGAARVLERSARRSAGRRKLPVVVRPRKPSRAVGGCTGHGGPRPRRRCASRRDAAGRYPAGPGPTGAARGVEAVGQRSGHDPATFEHTLFGPPPATDADLVNLLANSTTSKSRSHSRDSASNATTDQDTAEHVLALRGESRRPLSARTPSSAVW